MIEITEADIYIYIERERETHTHEYYINKNIIALI